MKQYKAQTGDVRDIDTKPSRKDRPRGVGRHGPRTTLSYKCKTGAHAHCSAMKCLCSCHYEVTL